MKYFLSILVLTLFSFFLEAKEFNVTLEARRSAVRLGEYIQLILHSDKKVDKIEYPAIPGAKWAENIQSSGTRYVNGKVSHMKTLYLAPEKEDSFTIPPFKVYSGKDSGTTQELKVRVLPREQMGSEEGKSYKISDIVQGRISITPSGRSIYAGEEMTINCDLLVDERFANQIQLSYYPEFTRAGNALFTTWNVRGGKSRFKADRPVQVVEKETPFIRYRFTAFCRVLKPGPFEPGVTQRIGVIRSNRSQEDPFDGFFGGMGGFFSSSSVEPYTVNYTKASAVEVKALPAPPAGVFNTCLVGKWQVKGTLSSNSLRQGEVCELLLTFQGTGSGENFSAPQISAPGFRVYPAEVEKKENSVIAKYAMIPLETGELTIKVCPGIFDAAAEKWVSTPLEFKAAAVKGVLPATQSVQKNFAPKNAPQAPVSEVPESGEEANYLLYQKNAPGTLVRMPLVKNALGLVIFFGLICPLAAVGIEVFFRRREKEASSPELQRKKELKKELRQLVSELNSKGDSAEFRARLIPVLGEALGLSAGAAAGEIAGKMKDEELCSYFSRLDFAGFSPVSDEQELKLDNSAKKALVKLLKSLSVIGLLVFSLPLSGTEINAEFNAGNFESAAKKYMTLAKSSGDWRPDMLYNYGNAQYRLNNLPEARWALTKASLLKPWDGEIKANLQLVNSNFFKNPDMGKGSFTVALRDLRDTFRCDHYLIAGAFFWAFIWFLWSFRRRISFAILSTATFFAAFFCLLCLSACFTQMQSTYSDKRIMVTSSSAQLRSLPGKNAGSVETTVTGGSEAELIQYDNSGYARVRLDNREGWLPVQSFRKVIE